MELRTPMMEERLDHLFERMSATPADRSLDMLDLEIGRAISRRRREARTATALAPVRMASIGLALAMGVTVGGVTAATAIVAPPQPGAFALAGDLAPSALLEGAR
jgi:hypothetical protein